MMTGVYPNLVHLIERVKEHLSKMTFNHYIHRLFSMICDNHFSIKLSILSSIQFGESVHLVDLYPVSTSETTAISHVVQIAYGSQKQALSREQADLFRMEVPINIYPYPYVTSKAFSTGCTEGDIEATWSLSGSSRCAQKRWARVPVLSMVCRSSINARESIKCPRKGREECMTLHKN